MIHYAVKKLVYKPIVEEESKIAALDIRILLGFDAAEPSSRKREADMVERYLRVAYVVPEHREFIRSGYSSEPLLAEAAARILNMDPEMRSTCLTEAKIATEGPLILAKSFNDGFLARGERGEMCARLLVTIAHDRAILGSGKIELTGQTAFHQPIKVVQFLIGLFSEEFHETVLNARPIRNKRRGIPLREAFENAYLNFSHFSRAGDYEVVTLEYLWTTLIRGTAFQCKNNQRAIDLVFAVFFGSPSKDQICKSLASILQIQVKNRKTEESFIVNPSVCKPSKNWPILTIVLELDSPDEPLVDVKYEDPQRTRGYVIEEDPHSRHYMIVARGCSSKTYSAIPDECNASYQSILASDTFASDFPRMNSPENRAALYRLIPTWNAEDCELREASMKWAVSAMTQQAK
jgi:hypothetical protein